MGSAAGWRAVVTVAVVAGLQACSSGSGGSEVGNSEPLAPIARAQVLNASAENTFREGAEVFLTGKASEDYDGPLLYWDWIQTAGPGVTLIERNKTTVSFTAPDVSDDTTLTFRLTVEDSHGDTDQETISITVLPAQDPNRFLALDVRGPTANTFNRFKVIPTLATGASTGSAPLPFTLSVVAHLIYPPRTNPAADCELDLGSLSGPLPTQTSGGCLISVLADLTPGGGVTGQWPADIPAVPANQSLADMWWNTQFDFELPRLDAGDFNQQFVDSGARNRMLDLVNAHRARIVLSFELSAPNDPSAATLVVTDRNSTLLAAQGNSGTGLPTSAYLDVQELAAGINGKESALTAAVYYRTVDPLDQRLTLNAWLQHAGFAADSNGTLIANAEDGQGEFAHAVYLNNYDLGFGRDMYTRTDEFGNVYAFVVNYSTLEGAIRKIDPIATVVMEYSPLLNASDSTEKFVKFFTYIEDKAGDSPRVASMNFDGRGELFTPGNCVVCHGGSKPPDADDMFDPMCGNREDLMCYAWPTQNDEGDNITDGNLNATFLPWDLDSLLFADTDPAITRAPVPLDGVTLQQELRNEFGDFSQSAQVAQIKRLNQAAYRTYCNAAADPSCGTDAARRLVEHWYQGIDQSGNLIGAFNDAGSPPEGWRNTDVGNPGTTEELYRRVYAQYCRMCHTNIRDSLLQFDTYQKLLAQQAKIEEVVFQQGLMPAARLTADRFWVSFAGGETAAERLATEFGVQPVNGHLGPAPLASISGNQSPIARHSVVRLSGRESTFASSFSWQTTFTPPPELAGNPTVANYAPTLVGSSSAELSFAPAQPGIYNVGLTINGAAGPTATPVEIIVPNFQPQPSDIAVSLAEGSSRQISVLTTLNALCAAPNCPEVFGDGPATISVNTGAWSSANGVLTVNNAATGTFTIQATQPGPISATIPFTVTDVDGEATSADIDISIVQLTAPMAGSLSGATMVAQTTVNPPGNQSVTFSPLTLPGTTGDPSGLPLNLNAVSTISSAVGTLTPNFANDTITFTPALGFAGPVSFQYNVIDSNPTGGRVSTNGTISLTVNRAMRFSVEVQNAFSAATCLSCHDGGVAPDWRVYSNVLARTVANPASARTSKILTCPRVADDASCNYSETPLVAEHGQVLGPAAQPDWTESGGTYSAHFRNVLRWIEEGRQNN